MYLTVDGGEVLVINPHIDKDVDRYLKENGVGHDNSLTHEHFDHTCGPVVSEALQNDGGVPEGRSESQISTVRVIKQAE